MKTKWATVIIWLYSSVKAVEFSWYGDVILDTCCQNITSDLVSVWAPLTRAHPSKTWQDLVRVAVSGGVIKK